MGHAGQECMARTMMDWEVWGTFSSAAPWRSMVVTVMRAFLDRRSSTWSTMLSSYSSSLQGINSSTNMVPT